MSSIVVRSGSSTPKSARNGSQHFVQTALVARARSGPSRVSRLIRGGIKGGGRRWGLRVERALLRRVNAGQAPWKCLRPDCDDNLDMDRVRFARARPPEDDLSDELEIIDDVAGAGEPLVSP